MKIAAFGLLCMVCCAAILPIAAGKNEVPYIEIVHPEDGSTVEETTTLYVIAEGFGLNNPTLTVKGENYGFHGPLSGCEFIVPANNENESTKTETIMKCKSELDLSEFNGEKVIVDVNVDELSGVMTDSVGLYVSGLRNWV